VGPLGVVCPNVLTENTLAKSVAINIFFIIDDIGFVGENFQGQKHRLFVLIAKVTLFPLMTK
jgi:hypothetical protein